LKHASAPPQSYDQRLELAGGTSPRALQVILALFRCSSAELFISCCDSVAALRATAWAPRSNTCDIKRAAPRVTAWSPRSSTCDAQRAAPRTKAWAPRPSSCAVPRSNQARSPEFRSNRFCLRPQVRSARPGLLLADLPSRSARPGLFLINLTSRSGQVRLILANLKSRSGQDRSTSKTADVRSN